ncbi:hypothetical protein HDU76_013949 [Blyttiomyces sp. JEL0837]|nr:hypothetical protein HDU76_013949 [Blyttiomyces sp. JEL0837]
MSNSTINFAPSPTLVNPFANQIPNLHTPGILTIGEINPTLIGMEGLRVRRLTQIHEYSQGTLVSLKELGEAQLHGDSVKDALQPPQWFQQFMEKYDSERDDMVEGQNRLMNQMDDLEDIQEQVLKRVEKVENRTMRTTASFFTSKPRNETRTFRTKPSHDSDLKVAEETPPVPAYSHQPSTMQTNVEDKTKLQSAEGGEWKDDVEGGREDSCPGSETGCAYKTKGKNTVQSSEGKGIDRGGGGYGG